MDNGIKSGDKVVYLAGAAQSAAVIVGAVAGAIAGWMTTHRIVVTGASLVLGGVIGLVVGKVVGLCIFTRNGKKVQVVKTGLRSLPLVLRGNIIASGLSGLAVCLLAVIFLNAEIREIAVPVIGVPVIIGIILAVMASLL